MDITPAPVAPPPRLYRRGRHAFAFGLGVLSLLFLGLGGVRLAAGEWLDGGIALGVMSLLAGGALQAVRNPWDLLRVDADGLVYLHRGNALRLPWSAVRLLELRRDDAGHAIHVHLHGAEVSGRAPLRIGDVYRPPLGDILLAMQQRKRWSDAHGVAPPPVPQADPAAGLPPRVLRFERGNVLAGVVLGGAIMLFGWLADFGSPFADAGIVAMGALMALPGLFALRGGVEHLKLDAQGLTIRKALGAVRVPWARVQDIALHDLDGGAPVVLLRLRGSEPPLMIANAYDVPLAELLELLRAYHADALRRAAAQSPALEAPTLSERLEQAIEPQESMDAP